MIHRTPHKVNGRFYGMWYVWDSGQQLYLAHRSGEAPSRGFFVKKNAWCIDKQTLREAEHRGCDWIGVLHRVKGQRYLYATRLRDFWDSPYSEDHREGDTPQRMLNRKRFLIHPGNCPKSIASMIKLR